MTHPRRCPEQSGLDVLPRVLHVSPFSQLAGANRSMLTLVSELARRGDTALFLATNSDVAEMARQAGVRVYTATTRDRLPAARLIRGPLILYRLARAVRDFRPALIHAHSATGNRWCAPVCRWLNLKLVTHQRDIWRDDPFHAQLPAADRIIAISEWVRSTLPATLRERATVVHNAVAMPNLCQTSEHGTAADAAHPLRIGMAGRWVPEKGFDLFVEAVAMLPAEHFAGVSLWGLEPEQARRTAYEQAILACIDALPPMLRDRFDVQPFRPDIESFYQRHDVVVVPSRFAEPFGRVAIEAMAHGCIVVVAAHGGLTEIVDHNRNGLCFEPGNAQALSAQLLAVADNPILRRKLATEARHDAAMRFSPQAHASAVTAIYQQLVTAR